MQQWAVLYAAVVLSSYPPFHQTAVRKSSSDDKRWSPARLRGVLMYMAREIIFILKMYIEDGLKSMAQLLHKSKFYNWFKFILQMLWQMSLSYIY